MTTQVDDYIARSENWPAEMSELRTILLDCGLDETLKWGKPCYADAGANIVIMQEMKEFLALMFFKGMFLRDAAAVLEPNGPNSRSAKRMCFTSVDDVQRLAATIREYVTEAIAIEAAGIEAGPAPEPLLVDELRQRLDADPALEAAFEALTPGRQREYHLYFSTAKQASTRAARIDKYVDKIMAGKGFRDR